MTVNFDELRVIDTDENGLSKVSDEAADKLQKIDDKIDELDADKKELRARILAGMTESKIQTSTASNGMKFSQRVPSKIKHFDTDSFLLNESEDVVSCFTSFTETEAFDIEAFKAENPELYEKYLKKDMIAEVDQDKLAKGLPNIFKKYYSEEDSGKPTTLIVTKKRRAK